MAGFLRAVGRSAWFLGWMAAFVAFGLAGIALALDELCNGRFGLRDVVLSGVALVSILPVFIGSLMLVSEVRRLLRPRRERLLRARLWRSRRRRGDPPRST